MGLWKRIFGICETKPPASPDGWKFADGIISIDVLRTPELSKAGGAVRLEGNSLPQRVLVLHGTDGSYHAFVNRCTHMGRRLDPLAGEVAVRCCSVSKSIFAYDGEPLSGAAKSALKILPVDAEENRLSIRLSETV